MSKWAMHSVDPHWRRVTPGNSTHTPIYPGRKRAYRKQPFFYGLILGVLFSVLAWWGAWVLLKP